jgi:hypothetical protein
VELIISSEFYDSIPGLLAKCSIMCSHRRHSDDGDVYDNHEDGEEKELVPVWVKGEVAAYDIVAPDAEGEYRVTLRGDLRRDGGDDDDNKDDVISNSSSSSVVLSWISEKLTVCSADGSDNNGDGSGNTKRDAARMLSCFRAFDCRPPSLQQQQQQQQHLCLREDYGAGMGSHIYDSAVVLLRYLSSSGNVAAASGRGTGGVAIELGSGCGLVGLYLGHTSSSSPYSAVLLSDKASQIPLLRENVERNGSSQASSVGGGAGGGAGAGAPRYSVQAFDWASRKELSGMQETITRIRNSGGEGEERALLPVELVVAADVLYDAEAAAHLASVVTELVSTCNGTAPAGTEATPTPTVLIAQKMRGSEAADIATLLPQLRCELVYEEFRVKVWRLVEVVV